VSLFYDRDYSCSTSLHLHNVTDYFLVSLILRCHEYRWESFFDQGDEAVLALACRIRDRRDIAQLQEFQSSFQGCWHADSSPEETDARCATADLCNLLHVLDPRIQQILDQGRGSV